MQLGYDCSWFVGKPDVKLVGLKIAGTDVDTSLFSITDKGKLCITSLPTEPFELEIETEIKPQVWLVVFALT